MPIRAKRAPPCATTPSTGRRWAAWTTCTATAICFAAACRCRLRKRSALSRVLEAIGQLEPSPWRPARGDLSSVALVVLLEYASPYLVQFYRLEQRLEVAFAETLITLALDEL